MMNFTSKDVFAKRKVDLNEAYNMAIQLINNPNCDDWDIRAFAWCVIDLIKREAKAGNISDLSHYRQQLEAIQVPQIDEVLLKQRDFAIQLCNPNRSVTSHDVFDKRKTNLDEAYAMAIKLLNSGTADEWGIRAFAWCLVDLIKRESANNETSNLMQYKQQLESLNIPSDDNILLDNKEYALRLCNPNLQEINKAKSLNKEEKFSKAISIYWQILNSGDSSDEVRYGLGWAMYKYSKQELAKIHPNFGIIKRYLNDFFKLNIEATDEADTGSPSLYTFMLRIADKLGSENRIRMASYVKIWNLDNLTNMDYEQFTADDGKTYPSLAEKVIQHSCKDAVSRNSIDEVNYLFPYLENCIEIHTDNIWLKWYKTKMLLVQGQYAEAMSIALEVIKSKSTEFWAWELIGDIVYHTDKEMALSAYCKALTLSQDINFTSKVRIKLAQLLIEKEEYDLAKTEVTDIINFKANQQHKIPIEIENIISESWYSSVEGSKNNSEFYKNNAEAIEAYLYQNLPWVKAIAGNSYSIKNKNNKRKIYISTTNVTPIEVSLPESRFQHLPKIETGDGLRVKGEYDNQNNFQVLLIETRQITEKLDIFSSVIGIVDNINHDKKLIHYLVDKNIDGIIQFAELKDKFSEGETIELKLATLTTPKGKGYRVIFASKTTESAPEHLLKIFDSTVSVSNGMGFTEDNIFISPPIVAKYHIENGDEIKGKAILNYNKKRAQWGWRAFSIN